MMAARARDWLLAGDRWIPGLFILFFIGLAIVEARLVTIAIGSSTGLVTETPHRDAGAGWRLSLDVPSAPGALVAGEALPIVVRLARLDGQPLTGARVQVIAERPSRYAQIVSTTLEGHDGRHVGTLRLPIGGRWDLTIVAQRGAERMTRVRALDVAAGGRQ